MAGNRGAWADAPPEGVRARQADGGRGLPPKQQGLPAGAGDRRGRVSRPAPRRTGEVVASSTVFLTRCAEKSARNRDLVKDVALRLFDMYSHFFLGRIWTPNWAWLRIPARLKSRRTGLAESVRLRPGAMMKRFPGTRSAITG